MTLDTSSAQHKTTRRATIQSVDRAARILKILASGPRRLGGASRADAAVRVGVMHGASVVIVHHVFRPDTTLQILEGCRVNSARAAGRR